MTDLVFGPPRTNGTNQCPDCRAAGGYPCTQDCTRRQPRCACDGTGWITTEDPGGTLSDRPCRDCLGPSEVQQ